MRQSLACVLAAAAVVAALPSVTVAQSYPDRPVRVLVGFAAGGTVDVPTRIVAAKLGSVLGVSVVVDNKPGAGGGIAAATVAKSAPDGYTFRPLWNLGSDVSGQLRWRGRHDF